MAILNSVMVLTILPLVSLIEVTSRKQYLIYFKQMLQSRKFYIKRNNNKVDSFETRRVVISQLLPEVIKLLFYYVFSITDHKTFYCHYNFIVKYNLTHLLI